MGKKRKSTISAKEQQRRAAQAQQAQMASPKKKIESSADFIKGFISDVINISQVKTNLKTVLQDRIKRAEKLVEGNPMKFNVLRTDTYKEVLKKFEPIDQEVKNLMGIVGELDDKQTFADKMMFLGENMDKLSNVMLAFNDVSMELQQVDARFNQQLAGLIKPANMTPEMDDLQYKSSAGTAQLCMDYLSTIVGAPGTLQPLHLNFQAEKPTDDFDIVIKLNDAKFTFAGAPYEEDHIEIRGNVEVINDLLAKYDVVVGEVPSTFIVCGIPEADNLPILVKPIDPQRMTDEASVEVSAEEAETIMNGIENDSLTGSTDPEEIKREQEEAVAEGEAEAAKVINFSTEKPAE